MFFLKDSRPTNSALVVPAMHSESCSCEYEWDKCEDCHSQGYLTEKCTVQYWCISFYSKYNSFLLLLSLLFFIFFFFCLQFFSFFFVVVFNFFFEVVFLVGSKQGCIQKKCLKSSCVGWWGGGFLPIIKSSSNSSWGWVGLWQLNAVN
jgi:hypothetical protein